METPQSQSQPPNVLKILRSNGWGTGFYNPFADEHNKSLEQKLELLQRTSQLLVQESEDIKEHVNNLRQHELNLHVDIKMAHDMACTKIIYVDRERSVYSQSEKDLAFTRREVGRLKAQHQDLLQRNTRTLVEFEKRQKDVAVTMEQIEQDAKLVKCFKWRELGMEGDLSEMSTFQTLDKDEVNRVRKELTTLELINRDLHQSLDDHLRNTTKSSDDYRRLCLQFRQGHRKRKEMLVLWTTTLGAIRDRDNDLQEMAAEYYELKNNLKIQISTYDCLVQFLEHRSQELEEVEYRSNFYDTLIQNIAQTLESTTKLILALKTDHLRTVSATQKLSAANSEFRQKIDSIRTELNTGFEQESILKTEIERLATQLDTIQKVALDSDKLLKQLETILENEDILMNKLEKRGQFVRKFHFEKTNEKMELLEKIRTVQTRTEVINRIFMRLSSSEYENTSNMAKRQSRLYRADLEVSTLEIKISRILNSTIEPRYYNLQLRAERLRTKNHYIQATNNFVGREADRIADTLHVLFDDIEAEKDGAKQLDLSVVQARLSLTEVNRSAQAISNHLKQNKFKFTIVKITVSRLSNTVNAFTGKIFTLAQIRKLLNTAGAERKAEIDFHCSLVKKKMGLLKKEMGFLEMSQCHTVGWIRKLRVKFDILSGGKGSGDDDVTNILFSQIKNIVKERANLIKDRCEWEGQVESDLKEIKGLEKVVEVLMGANHAYKLSLMPACQSGGDAKVRELEDLQKRMFVYRNRCKRHIRDLDERGIILKKEMGAARVYIQKATLEADEKVLTIWTHKAEIEYLQERIRRWDQLISRISKDKGIWEDEGLLYYIQLDLNHKLLEEKCEQAMRKMLWLMKRDQHIRKTIYLFLKDEDMMETFIERLHLTERKIFAQYCELHGERSESTEECRNTDQEEEEELDKGKEVLLEREMADMDGED